MVVTVFFPIFICFATVSSQAFEDKRCRCICPSPATVFNSSLRSKQKNDRRLFISYVPPNKCNCYEVILPKMGKEVVARAQEFCPRCECKYETRNTTVIMVVVILVLWILTLFSIYLVFLLCLDPFINKRFVKEYMETESEEAQNLLEMNDYGDD